MTQQPYYQPQYPVAPQPQGYPQQAPQTVAQPVYAQPYPQQQVPQQPPPVPLANGSLDAFYSQPTGGGPGVSWKGKPDGFTIQGLVPRDVTNGDVTQEVGAPNTQEAGRPQTYRDGRPKFVMAVPLQVAPSPEFPEGEARLFVRGQLREELSRAMAEAQATEPAPVGGSFLTVTLVGRKQGRGAIPQNIFRVVYTPVGGTPPAIQQPTAQPVQQYAPQPVQHYAPQPVAQPQPVQQYVPQPVATGAPSPVPVAQQPVQYEQQPVSQAAPVQQAPAPLPAPENMPPEQQALLQKIMTAQGQAQA